MDPTDAAFRVLTAMITPAVLISACGTLAFSTGTRLSRVVDRVRGLAAGIERAPDGGEGPFGRGLVLDQLEQLSRRVLLLRSAMTGFYVAIGLFVLTSLAVGVVALTRAPLGWVPVATGLLGSVALLHGSVLLVREARLAVASTLEEMSAVRTAVQRSRAGSGS